MVVTLTASCSFRSKARWVAVLFIRRVGLFPSWLWRCAVLHTAPHPQVPSGRVAVRPIACDYVFCLLLFLSVSLPSTPPSARASLLNPRERQGFLIALAPCGGCLRRCFRSCIGRFPLVFLSKPTAVRLQRSCIVAGGRKEMSICCYCRRWCCSVQFVVVGRSSWTCFVGQHYPSPAN